MVDPHPNLRPLSALQPSQLFISIEKLANVQTSIDFSTAEGIPPIPIKHLEGRWVMTDGHTRAYAAYRAGLERILTVVEQDLLDWEAYLICVGWCRSAGITEIGDLDGRVLSAGEYALHWLDRCDQMHHDLDRLRGRSDREATS